GRRSREASAPHRPRFDSGAHGRSGRRQHGLRRQRRPTPGGAPRGAAPRRARPFRGRRARPRARPGRIFLTMTVNEDVPPRTTVHRRHTARWVAGVTLVVGAALVAVLATRPPQTATEVDTPLVGQVAPGIAGATLAGGSFDLAGQRGRWVVVNFFASWCPPCQQEQPELV